MIQSKDFRILLDPKQANLLPVLHVLLKNKLHYQQILKQSIQNELTIQDESVETPELVVRFGVVVVKFAQLRLDLALQLYFLSPDPMGLVAELILQGLQLES